MFGKIKLLFLILSLIFFMTCVLGDDIESRRDPDSVTLTFNANGGVGTVPPITDKIGKVIILPNSTTISKINHKFVSWNENALGTGNNYLEGGTYNLPNIDPTLYAVWEPVDINTHEVFPIPGTFNSGNLGTTWIGFNKIDDITTLYKEHFNIPLLKSEGYTKVTLRFNYTITVWGDIEYEIILHNLIKNKTFVRLQEKLSGNNRNFNKGIECTVNLSELEINNIFDELVIQARYRKQNALWGGDFRIRNRQLIISFSKE